MNNIQGKNKRCPGMCYQYLEHYRGLIERSISEWRNEGIINTNVEMRGIIYDQRNLHKGKY